ncbi:MAG: AraC family transcriptional regulator [Planctomycetes bacterium]|nr:AraC family transcriptional regulator [Planctomycetota bacterium]
MRDLWIRAWERPVVELPALAHFNEAKVPPGMVLPPHRHDTFEVCLIVAGRAHWTNPDGTFSLGAGDLYITSPGEVHDGRADARDPQHNYAIGFDLGSLVAGIGDPALGAAEASAVDALAPRRRVIPGGGRTARIFAAIRQELEELPAVSDPQRRMSIVMLQALLVELAVMVTRLAIAARVGDDAHLAAPTRRDFALVDQRLHASLGAPPSLAEMASWMGLSPGHFAVAFKRAFGRTPLEHLTRLRIEAAAERLRSDRRTSVTGVALDFGFCSSQYFSEVFKRVTGRTPSGWRAGE